MSIHVSRITHSFCDMDFVPRVELHKVRQIIDIFINEEILYPYEIIELLINFYTNLFIDWILINIIDNLNAAYYSVWT